MIELGMIRDIVTILGVVAGFSYYVMTVRNTNRARKLLIAQRYFERLQNRELQLMSIDVLEMEWDDFDDFYKKYDSTVNKENFAKRSVINSIYSELGFMLKHGMIDIQSIFDLMGSQGIIMNWNKFKPVFLAQRELYNDPNVGYWIEYLADEVMKERVRRGLTAQPTDADGYTTKNTIQ